MLLLLTVSAHSIDGITPSQSPTKFVAPVMGLTSLAGNFQPNSIDRSQAPPKSNACTLY